MTQDSTRPSPAWTRNAFVARLGVDLPIVQAPLGGGPGTPELTAAVANAGALGTLGVGYLDPDDVRQTVRRTRALTDRPFAANLFLAPPPRRTDSTAARARIADVARQLDLEADVPAAPRGLPDTWAQLDVLVHEGVPVVSFAFGCPTPDMIRAVHESGALCLATAGSVDDARALADAGVDAIVAQSFEAGGHRGGLTAVAEAPGLVALVPAVVDAVDVPVVASGGIMDGRGVVAALALGAQAAALGTAFLRATEAGTNAAYRQALRLADETSTVTTTAFSGKAARGIRNRYIEAFGPEDEVPDFPVMNYLTRPLRTSSAASGSGDAQSLWAGQGVRQGRDLPAGELVAALVTEADLALRRLGPA